MKTRLLQVAVAAAILASASMAFAGEGCHSKKGHEGMSAEMMKEFKDGHAWLFSEDGAHHGKSTTEGDAAVQQPAKEKTAAGVVEI